MSRNAVSRIQQMRDATRCSDAKMCLSVAEGDKVLWPFGENRRNRLSPVGDVKKLGILSKIWMLGPFEAATDDVLLVAMRIAPRL